jgi:ketosteroid isomerase-like protein
VTPLSAADIPSTEVFEAIRDELRARVIAHKAPRRVALGENLTLLFEDRETLRWQILEMCRVERTRDAGGVANEVAVYNELVPGRGELSATMFIEITDPAKIRSELDRLIGIDDCIWLVVGARRVKAKFDARQLEEDRISAVHYLRFTLAAEDVAAFGDAATPVGLRAEHAAYRAEAKLSAATRASLLVDLGGDPPPLLDFSRAVVAAARDRVLEESARFRVVAPARPQTPGSLRVEARDPNAPAFTATPPDALAEAMALAQKYAGEIARAGGAARVGVDANAQPLRIEIVRIA